MITKYSSWLFVILSALFVFDCNAQFIQESLRPGAIDRATTELAKELTAPMPEQIGMAKVTVLADRSKVPEKLLKAVTIELKKKFPQIIILDREHLMPILGELGKRLEEYANPKTAPDMRRIEVAQVIVFVHAYHARIFWEFADIEAGMTVVDVETAELYWQSPTLRSLHFWIGAPAGVLFILFFVLLGLFKIARGTHGREIAWKNMKRVEGAGVHELSPLLKAALSNLGTAYQQLNAKGQKNIAIELKKIDMSMETLETQARSLSRGGLKQLSKKESEEKVRFIESMKAMVNSIAARIEKYMGWSSDDRFQEIQNEMPELQKEIAKLKAMFDQYKSFY